MSLKKIFFNWDQDHNFHLVNITFLHDNFSNLEQFLSSPLIRSSSWVFLCISWLWQFWRQLPVFWIMSLSLGLHAVSSCLDSLFALLADAAQGWYCRHLRWWEADALDESHSLVLTFITWVRGCLPVFLTESYHFPFVVNMYIIVRSLATM